MGNMPTDNAIRLPASTGLSGLRRESQGPFELLTAVLGKVHQTLVGIGGDFGRLTKLVDEVGTARGVSCALRTTCMSLADHLATAHSAISSPELAHALKDGLAAVESLQRECRQLSAIASMTRVTGHSVNIDAIEDYIVTLRGMIQRLATTTLAVQDGLGSMDIAVKQAAGQLGDAANCARMAIDGREDGEAPPEMDGIGGTVLQLSERLRASTLSNTGVLMNGIQFSDAFAQRLEHIEVILNAVEAEPLAAALAAAQITALVDDSLEMLSHTRGALEQLGAVGQSAADSLAGDMGAQAAQMLDVWRTELADAHQIERLVGPALTAAMSAVGNIDTAITTARQNFETLSATALDVSLATVNAGLLAMRSGAAKAAMDVLSTTVRESAHACSELNSRCRTRFATIDNHTQNADFSQLTAQAEKLSALIAKADKDLELASEMFARLESMQNTAGQSAVALQKAVQEGLMVLDGLPGLISATASHAPKVASTIMPPNGAEVLQRFDSLYTMVREREIHASLVGTASPADADVGAAEPQSMDDIFF